MTELLDAKQQREEALLSAFLEMVRSPDGDFGVIDRLAIASADSESLQLMIQSLSSHSQGKLAFETYPRVGEVDLEQLAILPKHTLGYAYAQHMFKNNLKPLQIKPSNNDYEFLGAHITETHDIWHVITGFETTIIGEIQLEAFYVSQMRFSRFWLALITKNLLKTVVYDIERSTEYMDAVSQGWLLAKHAQPLFGIDWKLLWEKPLTELRDSLNIRIL
ncbi:Coq4 family protein [Pseudanabaena sp. Chao 1811]|uniref:Coq4 family protein n=1 Tax=Pseudanabaena sp. Chao 1811 TaxID=2963092 RepID=UPI0022F385F0|nr:Coq4 family protein [Pseudanabaena sp. Chao 1811]